MFLDVANEIKVLTLLNFDDWDRLEMSLFSN